ncbi:MAG TPA: YggT family protein [Pyrinomonadaceae bacterium]|nr:YggT family protein [Pyrinomonadaceae bacterium]
MEVIGFILNLIWLLVIVVIVTMVALMLARFILNYADVNPFSSPVLFVRRFTDPFVNPVRRALMGFGIQPNGAPLFVVLLTILLGYFVYILTASVLNTLAGILLALTSGSATGVVAIVGYLLYGALALYGLLIMIRIIFSWGQVSYGNRLMRLLVNVTDPLLLPLRRIIPPLGMFDISPIVAFIIIWLFQTAIQVTLLRGWPLNLAEAIAYRTRFF